eukprot:COSAG01_NODE_3996_length_5448_cov_24.489250_3_plen_162_part_00
MSAVISSGPGGAFAHARNDASWETRRTGTFSQGEVTSYGVLYREESCTIQLRFWGRDDKSHPQHNPPILVPIMLLPPCTTTELQPAAVAESTGNTSTNSTTSAVTVSLRREAGRVTTAVPALDDVVLVIARRQQLPRARPARAIADIAYTIPVKRRPTHGP